MASNKHLYTAKKILTCIPPSEVTHVYLLDLDSTASCSCHGSVLCQNPTNQASCDLTFQICAHQAFAGRNRPHKRAPRPPVRKTQKSDQLKTSHVPPRTAVSSGISPTRRLRFLTSRSCYWYTRCHDGLLVQQSTKPEILALIQEYTRHPKFRASPPRAGDYSHVPHASKTVADVIRDVI